MNKLRLNLPIFRKENIITSYAQIRPHREAGFRIQKQIIQEKNIFHNYGHGGSGISLSYGSAQRITDLFEKQVTTKNNQCAVLGCGIIGLLTALQLRKRGQAVKVYTKKIPSFGQKQNKLMITSEVAPGFWFPYDYLNIKQLNIEDLCKRTTDFLKKSIEAKSYLALKAGRTYDQVYPPELIQKFNQFFITKNKQVQIGLGNGNFQKFNSFTTVRIDMQLWLRQLITEAVRIGVEFTPRQFHNLKEVLALKQKYIFNCTGYGSKYLFDDKGMKAFRGHIIQFQNPDPSVFNFIFGAKINNQIVRIYCHETRILLGLSKQQNEQIEVDDKTVNKLLQNYQNYRKKWCIPSASL